MPPVIRLLQQLSDNHRWLKDGASWLHVSRATAECRWENRDRHGKLKKLTLPKVYKDDSFYGAVCETGTYAYDREARGNSNNPSEGVAL